MGEYSRGEAAQRAGLSVDELNRIVELGIVHPRDGDRFTAGDVRKFGLIATLQAGGLPGDGIASEIQRGRLSLDFMDNPNFDHFSALSNQTFNDLSARTGISVDLLMVIREAIGASVPEPTDLVREIELETLPIIEAELQSGYPPDAVERLLRTMGDSLRRFALAEADAFRRFVIAPMTDRPGSEISAGAGAAAGRMSGPVDRALLAIYHAQQAHAWTANILEGFEEDLVEAGLYGFAERPPAMCFLDITGYTRLTAEQGDKAAARLADQLGRLVQRTSLQHGGRPVKWLGDGVMFFFRDPGPGVVAALEMAEGVSNAGLPPAHVGLHAGPVLFQDGDYYGQTVNIASRIAEYARPGEVLVSQAVVDASDGDELTFARVGPVELKGVAGTVELHVAHKA